MGDHRDEVEEAERNFEGRVMKEILDHGKETAAARIGSWMIMGNVCDSEQSDDDDESSSDEEDSEGSDVSSVSSDMAVEEDVSSSSSSSSFSNGPLYELSELLAQLPPTSQRSGLSRHYQGKSQSFTSLASVKSVEDLAKRAKPYRKNMKRQCKYYTTPKAMISKKQQQQKKTSSSSSRVSFLSPVSNARGSFFLNSVCKSSISLQKQKNFS